MLKRLIVAVALVCATLAPGIARAQSPEVAQGQAALAEMGQWMQQYQAVMLHAAQPLHTMDAYTDALDRFSSGDMSERAARREIEHWRDESMRHLREARESAQALRSPPSMALYGPEGVAIDTVLRSTRDTMMPTLDELERVIIAAAELGLSALEDRSKSHEARTRALYQASIQLTRVDRRRIDISVAAISRDHPMQALLSATQHYYDTLVVIPRYALEELDGGGDRLALVAELRRSAEGMRVELARARTIVQTMTAATRDQQAGPNAEINRIMMRLLETFPPSIVAYEGLVVGIDGAAVSLEAGVEVAEVWGAQEESDRSHLAEIERLERLRATLLANNNRQPL